MMNERAEDGGHLRRDDAHDGVVGAAGGVGRDQPDRPIRIGLGERPPAQNSASPKRRTIPTRIRRSCFPRSSCHHRRVPRRRGQAAYRQRQKGMGAMQELMPRAEKVGRLLKERGETIVVAESSTGGLISAALLALPGASAYFLGRRRRLHPGGAAGVARPPDISALGMRASTEPYARLLAQTARQRFSATWALAESGATGPDRQPLWRCRRPQLHRGCRRDRARDHARDRQRRPRRQHACVQRGRARSVVGGAGAT